MQISVLRPFRRDLRGWFITYPCNVHTSDEDPKVDKSVHLRVSEDIRGRDTGGSTEPPLCGREAQSLTMSRAIDRPT